MFLFFQKQVPSETCLIIKFRDESYNLLDDSSFEKKQIVVDERERMERHLRLNCLDHHLLKMGKFLRIARCELKRDPLLENEVRTNIRSVCDLCDETVRTLNQFERNSCEALISLPSAYCLIKNSQEKYALEILKQLQEMSEDMRDEAYKLSGKCKEQSSIIKKFGDKIVLKQGEIMKEKESNESKMKQLGEGIYQSKKQNDKLDLQSISSTKKVASTLLTIPKFTTDIHEIPLWYPKLEVKKVTDELEEYETPKQKYMPGNKKAEQHNFVIKSLEIALKTLDEIEDMMTELNNFWEELKRTCESIMSRSMKVKVQMLTNMEHQQDNVWQKDAFWVDALIFYVKWIALRDVCAAASIKVNNILKEIKSYFEENPKEEEALRDVPELTEEFY